MLSGRTPQNRLLANELLFSSRLIWFSEKKFLAGKPISDIKYNYRRSQNNNNFYLFNHQLNYLLAHYFADSKNIKSNIKRFLSNLVMASLDKKLSYQNADKSIEKLLKIP